MLFKLTTTLGRFSTLPCKLILLLNCLCSGPTSVRSLGTLFILSAIKTVWDVLPNSFVGSVG